MHVASIDIIDFISHSQNYIALQCTVRFLYYMQTHHPAFACKLYMLDYIRGHKAAIQQGSGDDTVGQCQ